MTNKAIPSKADYVIVGGGTAGLVLASRLSEDPSKTVVVLGAGKNLIEDARVQIPALWSTLIGSDADWQLKTVPQVRDAASRYPHAEQIANGTVLGFSSWPKNPRISGATTWRVLRNQLPEFHGFVSSCD